MKLSKQMKSVLVDIKNGLGTHGSATHKGELVGRYSTAQALRDRGLIDLGNDLTDAGHAALVEIEKEILAIKSR